MTVAELIEKLKGMPQDSLVYAEYEFYFLENVKLDGNGTVVLGS